MRQAKIVCTLGPAVANPERIQQLIEAGMDVARLNFSHGDHDTHRRMFQMVRETAQRLDKSVAILADISGPKIRLGDIAGGAVEIPAGAVVTITTTEVLGTAERISTNYPGLAADVQPGDRIVVDDGRYAFIVETVVDTEIVCRALLSGVIRSRKGMNIPDAGLTLPALTEKDRADITFARELGVDYFALSFVRRPEDVLQARELAGDIPIIAKIEKPQAIEQLESIAQVADGLMVARGDLGVEVGAEKVPLLQKRMIRMMVNLAKPVITATQMLESMVVESHPTRAEVSDVANAILDGTDAVMLSAETASGKNPIAAVQTMAKIIVEVEASAWQSKMFQPTMSLGELNFSTAIAHAAARAAVDLKLHAVAVYSESGRSARIIAAARPSCPIVGFARSETTLNRMALFWGVLPLHGGTPTDPEGIAEEVELALCARQLACPGHEIAICFGMEDGGPRGTTVLRLWKIRHESERS